MPVQAEIAVHCIAQTRVNPEATRNWLDQVGATEYEWDHPEPEKSVTDAVLAVGNPAKRCYKSFEVKAELNPNVTKVRKDWSEYLRNVLASGHGSVLEHASWTWAIENITRVFCYHPETEVLTRDGWKPVAALSAGEVLLTLNPETGHARWAKNHKLHQFEYAGPLYHWENREDRGPRVTPDHTLWCVPVNLRRARDMKAREAMQQLGRKVPFSEMLGRPFFVQNAIGEIEGVYDPTHVEVDGVQYDAELLFEWLGWVATDGTIAKDETGRSRVRVNQSKPEGVARLERLTNKLFGAGARITGSHYKAFDVSRPELRDWCVRLIGRTNEERNLLPLLAYSPRLIKAFLKGAFAGDGCHGNHNHRDMACGGNAVLAGHYQVLFAIAGRASRVNIRRDQVGQTHQRASGLVLTTTQPAVYVSEHQRGDGACIVKARHQRVQFHAGQVFCPQTDDGIVYVRAPGGKPVWCGNTAEMNRHRAGVAISEGSLRYIRSTPEDIPFWMPFSIREHPDDTPDIAHKKARTRAIFIKAFQIDGELYAEMCDLWAEELKPESKFAGKKQVTSMMRRIIGMGVCTGGVWTLNLRAIRHLFTMRCSPYAEEEICHAIGLVAKQMVESEPHLLGDFEQTPEGFWVPKYVKV